MSRKYKAAVLAALASVLVLPLPPAFAAGKASSPVIKQPGDVIDMAALAAALQAARDRKQSGDEVTLKKDVHLRGRPTGEPATGSVLHAGTVVRRSQKPLVNGSGSWRHIETRDGVDGWLYEDDLDP